MNCLPFKKFRSPFKTPKSTKKVTKKEFQFNFNEPMSPLLFKPNSTQQPSPKMSNSLDISEYPSDYSFSGRSKSSTTTTQNSSMLPEIYFPDHHRPINPTLENSDIFKSIDDDIEIIDDATNNCSYSLVMSTQDLDLQSSTPKKCQGRSKKFSKKMRDLNTPILKFNQSGYDSSTIKSNLKSHEKSALFPSNSNFSDSESENDEIHNISGDHDDCDASLSFHQAYQNHLKANSNMQKLLEERYKHMQTRLALEKLERQQIKLIQQNILYKQASIKHDKKIQELEKILNTKDNFTPKKLAYLTPKSEKKLGSSRLTKRVDSGKDMQASPLVSSQNLKQASVRKTRFHRKKVETGESSGYGSFVQICDLWVLKIYTFVFFVCVFFLFLSCKKYLKLSSCCVHIFEIKLSKFFNLKLKKLGDKSHSTLISPLIEFLVGLWFSLLVVLSDGPNNSELEEQALSWSVKSWIWSICLAEWPSSKIDCKTKLGGFSGVLDREVWEFLGV